MYSILTIPRTRQPASKCCKFGDCGKPRAPSKTFLVKAGHLLKKETSITAVIQGNTDDRGTEEYNVAPGQRRAAARDCLVGYGLDPARPGAGGFRRPGIAPPLPAGPIGVWRGPG